MSKRYWSPQKGSVCVNGMINYP